MRGLDIKPRRFDEPRSKRWSIQSALCAESNANPGGLRRVITCSLSLDQMP